MKTEIKKLNITTITEIRSCGTECGLIRTIFDNEYQYIFEGVDDLEKIKQMLNNSRIKFSIDWMDEKGNILSKDLDDEIYNELAEDFIITFPKHTKSTNILPIVDMHQIDKNIKKLFDDDTRTNNCNEFVIKNNKTYARWNGRYFGINKKGGVFLVSKSFND